MRRTLSAAALAAVCCPAPARADVPKVECIQANTAAQDARRDGKFSVARETLTRCIDPSCPAMVRDDCVRRLDELEKAQPTLVFAVKDRSGSDVLAVKVTVDGQPLVNGLDGKALAVDPGQHLFIFVTGGHAPVTRMLLIAEGEKGRRERIILESGGSPLPAPAPAPPSAQPTTPAAAPQPPRTPALSSSEPRPPEPPTEPGQGGGLGTQKVLGLVAGGVGVAGIAVGSVFGMMTISQKNQEVTDCPNAATCSPSSYSQASSARSAALSDGTISTVGFIAGGALLVGGLVLFFTAHSPQRPVDAGPLVMPSVGPGSGGMLLRGAF